MFTRRNAAAAALAVLAALQGCGHTSEQEKFDAAWADEKAVLIRQMLAPRGTLRAAMYQGSPTSFVQASPGDPPRGVGYELAEAFARQLGVPFEPKVYASNAEALRAVGSGQADFIFTDATPERARFLDFSPTVLDVQKSVLVVGKSRLKTLDDLRKPGLRIGVGAGSSTGEELKPVYPKARLVPVDTLANAVDMLASGKIDAFATNDAVLFEISGKLPGSRVLAGQWGVEHFAVGVPKGRLAGAQWIADFVQKAVADGLVQGAAQRARLRGGAQSQSGSRSRSEQSQPQSQSPSRPASQSLSQPQPLAHP
ncbi:transporter substrate-binding domain-containing protein [Bordetella bronchialis]|uniref:transporter substrate-binding domain-containing protein n=1 Tax=Bordetella bronchialis TaxID=463025 RepID=UPI003CFDC726